MSHAKWGDFVDRMGRNVEGIKRRTAFKRLADIDDVCDSLESGAITPGETLRQIKSILSDWKDCK